MSEIIKNKYLDFEGLKKYDGLIKGLIASGDAELADAIAALDAKIGSLDIEGSDDKNLSESISDIYASIADIIEAQGALEDKDDDLAAQINSIVGDLESLEGSDGVMTLVEITNKLKALEDSVSKNNQDIVGVTERVSALEETVKNLGEIEGGESLGDIVNKVNANAAAIETLKGDGEGSVKKAAADAQAAAEETAAADATSKADEALDAAKVYADGLVKDAEGKSLFDESGAADTALAEAKSYVDGKVDGKFDEAGAAAQALADAKADAASLYQVKGDYEAAGTAAGLNEAMDARVKVLESIDHDKIAADAVAAVVAGAESDFDTLKEVADWIAADKEGSAALQTTVSGHTESINAINGDLDALESKVDGDIANLTSHMTEASAALAEVDGRLDALEAFEETHSSIEVSEIEGLFA